MSRWFRFYEETLHDPKVLRLSDSMYRAWTRLLCVASINDGAIPKDDISVQLRVSEKSAASIIDYLIERDLLDDRGDFYVPHNWDGRQYKSDKTDPTAAGRQKRYRKNKKTDRNGDRNATVTVTATRADTEAEQIHDDEEVREPLISERANRLSEQIATICGHDLKFLPPSWLGAPYRVQTWVTNGWPDEIILASCREQIANRRGEPPDRIQYFEKGIASAIARQSAPLPEVKVIAGQTVEVKLGKSENLADVAKRMSGSVVGFGPRPSLTGSGENSNHVRLLPKGGGERS